MKNFSLFGMPSKVEFCKKCVISNQLPNSTVEFKSKDTKNKEGIELNNKTCSACTFAVEKEKINWNLREKKLIALLDKHRKKNGYDVVVPGSGGKDSAYTAHILKYKYGMNPLTVTWAPHLYTDIGWQNFTNWSHVGGLDNLLFTPNGILHRKATELAFKNLMHPFQPFIIGQKIIAPRIAAKFNIPLIMYGENPAEYANKIEENEDPKMDKSFFGSKNIKEIYLGGTSIKEMMKKYKFKLNEFEAYIPLEEKEIKEKKLEFHFLGYYLKWDQQECFYYAHKHTGFKPNTERTEGSYSKYSGIDDKIEYFHFYTTFIKFGLGRASYDAAQEIRNNKITREEGINLVKKFDHEFPNKYFVDFLDYVNCTEDDFYAIINSNRSPHLWSNKKGTWNLKYKIY